MTVQEGRYLPWFLTTALCALCSGPASSQQQPFPQRQLSTANSSRYTCNGNWAWRIYLQGTDERLNTIDYVDYGVQAGTAGTPVRVNQKGSATQPFSVTGTSLGTFVVPVSVVFKGGGRQEFRHQLRFLSQEATPPRPISVENTASQEHPGWWRWTVSVQAQPAVLGEVECVRYTLHPTFPQPVQERTAPRAGSHPFALSASGWGTFEVRVEVFFKDGRVQHLSHNLRF
jgi:transcription initiation factor IIF auxiliary subunit